MKDSKMENRILTPALRWNMDPCGFHLNHGSFGAVPVAVQNEQARLQSLMNWNPVRWFSSLSERIDEARINMAEILQVESEQVAFVFNASAGASTVYHALDSGKPLNVMVTNHGYGAVSMGARRLALRSGGTCTISRIPLNATAEEAIWIVLSDLERYQIDFLVIDQVTSASARAFPVDEICKQARAMGVTTLVDGAHAPGVLADPVCREADFWVGNFHKFACAPRGAAVVVSKEKDQRLFPLIDSWGAEAPFPQRFNHTGTMDTTPWLVAPFAWKHIEQTYGWSRVRK